MELVIGIVGMAILVGVYVGLGLADRGEEGCGDCALHGDGGEGCSLYGPRDDAGPSCPDYRIETGSNHGRVP
jgi:hypothetical protein